MYPMLVSATRPVSVQVKLRSVASSLAMNDSAQAYLDPEGAWSTRRRTRRPGRRQMAQ